MVYNRPLINLQFSLYRTINLHLIRESHPAAVCCFGSTRFWKSFLDVQLIYIPDNVAD